MTSLFSRLVPSGIMILAPSLATKIQVPASRTPLPIQTSPAMVKWSSSRMLGIDLNRFSKFCQGQRVNQDDERDMDTGRTATFLKLSPSLTTGVPPNSRDLSIVKTPCSKL